MQIAIFNIWVWAEGILLAATWRLQDTATAPGPADDLFYGQLKIVFRNTDIDTFGFGKPLELETKAIRRFAKVSIVSYSRPSLMIIELASQFHVYLPWGQRPFSIVS